MKDAGGSDEAELEVVSSAAVSRWYKGGWRSNAGAVMAVQEVCKVSTRPGGSDVRGYSMRSGLEAGESCGRA